jgi:pyruvate kinase
LLETKGPKIYTGFLKDSKPVCLTAGQSLKIVNDIHFEDGDNQCIACNYK